MSGKSRTAAIAQVQLAADDVSVISVSEDGERVFLRALGHEVILDHETVEKAMVALYKKRQEIYVKEQETAK